MKKALLLLILITASIFYANSQTEKIKYQGDFQLGYSLGIGTFPANRVNLHLVNGIRVNRYFSTGVGLGLDFYSSDDSASPGPEIVFPLFLNTKVYIPVANKTDLFLSLDLGTSIGVSSGVSGDSGFLCTPSVGAKFGTFSVGLGYTYQKWSAMSPMRPFVNSPGNPSYSINRDALQLKIGVTI